MKIETKGMSDSMTPLGKKQAWVFRPPRVQEGIEIHHLISSCSPLDENSPYCNYLQTSFFEKTCIIAQYHGKIVGFISAFLKPETATELFIWQVAVAPAMRSQGLAFQMLQQLLQRDYLQSLQALETTITKANQGSWSLFQKLDDAHGNRGSVSIFLDKQQHFNGRQETEYLYRIPLTSSNG